MKPTASRHRKSARTGTQAGFTLTEMVAGLLVASMLIVGLADITRRYALTTVRVKEIARELRTTRIVGMLMADLQRIDPGSLVLTADTIEAHIGAEALTARLGPPSGRIRTLAWTSPTLTRTVPLPASATFELTSSGSVVLAGAPGAPPLAIATPARTIPFDCRFDTVTRECR